MIDYSDNAATDALWSEIGRGAGMARFAGKIGMAGTVPGPDRFWIVTETTAVDEVRLMRALAYPNAVLSDASRACALGLMAHVTPTQRWGVSAAAQPGEQVALKNGWIIPLGGWATHSVGRIWGVRRDFVLAVMSFASPTKAAGVATTEQASRIAARRSRAADARVARPAARPLGPPGAPAGWSSSERVVRDVDAPDITQGVTDLADRRQRAERVLHREHDVVRTRAASCRSFSA